MQRNRTILAKMTNAMDQAAVSNGGAYKAQPLLHEGDTRMVTPFITGQLLMHSKGEKDGRTLFMVVGIVAVPPGQEWHDGHQYTVHGASNDQLTIELAAPIDRRGERLGTADTMFTSPIWRV